MNDNVNIPRLIAAVATILAALGIFFFMYFCPVLVSLLPKESKKGEIVLVEQLPEEFVEVIEPAPGNPSTEQQPQAHVDEPVEQPSQPQAAPGTDVNNSGKQGEKPDVVKSTKPSPVKEKKEETPKEKQGQASKPKEDTENDKVRRQAQNDVANAFNKGKNNSSTSETSDNGKSGSTTNSSSTGVAQVSGLKGSGWIIPHYSPVKSPVTGSIKATVKIDKTGKVTEVIITGGTPPAATTASVVNAVKREISSRKFTRSDYSEASDATAYITYTFK